MRIDQIPFEGYLTNFIYLYLLCDLPANNVTLQVILIDVGVVHVEPPLPFGSKVTKSEGLTK